MVQVAKLSADLVANTSNFEAGLNRSNKLLGQMKRIWLKQLGDIDGGFSGLGGTMGRFAKGAGIVGAAAIGAGGAMFALAKKSVDAASNIDDAAQRLQLGTTELQRFQYAAGLAGTSSETLEGALTKLNAKIADGDFKYKDAAEGLYSIAEAVKTAKTDTERLAIVNDAFGNKMGSKLLPMLTGGAEGLRKMGDEAERVGAVLSAETIAKAAKFGDTLDMISMTLKNNFNEGYLSQFVDESDNMREIFTDPRFTEGIKEVGKTVGELTEFTLKSVAALGRFIAAYRELENSGSFGLDEKLFRFGSKMFDSPEQQAATNARLRAKYNTKDYGVMFGPEAPKSSGSSVTPYVPSEETKKVAKAREDAVKAAEKQRDSLADIFNGLEDENAALDLQVQLYGEKESVLARANKELQIQSQLAKLGITLSAQQKADLKDQLDKYEQLTEAQQRQTEATRAQEEADKDRAQAWAQLSATFESAFEDAALGGEKLSDVLGNLLQDIQKLALRAYVTGPLMEALFGRDGKGGALKSLSSSVGSWFSGLSSHAAGIDYVPRDMMARVHKGEEIVSARDVKARERQGAEWKINIIDRAGNNITATPSSDGESLDIVVDRMVAKKLNQKGSRSNQALSTFANRTIIRR